MTDFSIESGVRIPDREKREAKRDLEQSIGDVTIDAQAAQSGPGRSGGSSTASLAGGAGVLDALDDQTDLLADIHDELQKIGTTGGGGGGGGGLLGGSSGVAVGSLLAGGGGGILSTLAAKGKSGLTRGLKGAGKGLGRRVPLLGGAVYGAEMLGEDTNKGRANALGGFLGGTAGALGGAKAGAAAGGALGSVLPGAGTAVGAGAGAIVGGVAGGIGGDQIGREVSDTLTSKLAGIDVSPPNDLWGVNLSPPDGLWPDSLSPPDGMWPSQLEPPDGFWPSERGGSDGTGDEILSLFNLNPDGETVDTQTPPGKSSFSPSLLPGPTTFQTPSGDEVTADAPRSTGSADLPDYITSDAQAQDLAMLFQNNRSASQPGDTESLSETQEARVDVVIQEVAARIDSGRALEDALRSELENVAPDIKQEVLREIQDDLSSR